MSGSKYSREEEELLKMLWESCDSVEEVRASFPNRSHAALHLKAAALGLKAFPRHRRARLEALLPDTQENWYWYGFILADGYFSSRGELSVTIDRKDEEHLRRLADLISTNVRVLKPTKTECGTVRQHCRLAAMNAIVVEALKAKLGLTTSPKTEAAPNMSVFETVDRVLLDALLVGFFDGDGCMREKGYGQIVCHENWIDFFKFFEKRGLVRSAKVSSGRARCTLPVASASRLKGLPVNKLERKWSKAK